MVSKVYTEPAFTAYNQKVSNQLMSEALRRNNLPKREDVASLVGASFDTFINQFVVMAKPIATVFRIALLPAQYSKIERTKYQFKELALNLSYVVVHVAILATRIAATIIFCIKPKLGFKIWLATSKTVYMFDKWHRKNFKKHIVPLNPNPLPINTYQQNVHAEECQQILGYPRALRIYRSTKENEINQEISKITNVVPRILQMYDQRYQNFMNIERMFRDPYLDLYFLRPLSDEEKSLISNPDGVDTYLRKLDPYTANVEFSNYAHVASENFRDNSINNDPNSKPVAGELSHDEWSNFLTSLINIYSWGTRSVAVLS
jgi:hypothetical protein